MLKLLSSCLYTHAKTLLADLGHKIATSSRKRFHLENTFSLDFDRLGVKLGLELHLAKVKLLSNLVFGKKSSLVVLGGVTLAQSLSKSSLEPNC